MHAVTACGTPAERGVTRPSLTRSNQQGTTVTSLNAKNAVNSAKTAVTDLFAQEGVFNLGLEEVEFDDAQEQWHITVGLSRSWDKRQGILADLASTTGSTYKVVTIDKEGKVLSIKNRDPANVREDR